VFSHIISLTIQKQVSLWRSYTCCFSWRYCITSDKTRWLYLQLCSFLQKTCVCCAPALTLSCHFAESNVSPQIRKCGNAHYKCQRS